MTLFSLFKPKTVEGAIAKLVAMVKHLEDIAEAKAEEAAAHIKAHEEALAEHIHASKVYTKLKELIG